VRWFESQIILEIEIGTNPILHNNPILSDPCHIPRMKPASRNRKHLLANIIRSNTNIRWDYSDRFSLTRSFDLETLDVKLVARFISNTQFGESSVDHCEPKQLTCFNHCESSVARLIDLL
jgi:hypothetical protein